MGYLAGKGTSLRMTEATSAFTEIAQRVEITGPAINVRTRPCTDLDSSAHMKHPTIMEGGDMNFTIYWDPTADSHKALTTLMTTPKSTTNWRIIYSTTTLSMTFVGILTKFDPTGMDVDGTLTANCTVKLNGAITFPSS